MGTFVEYTYLAKSITTAAEASGGQTITFASLGTSKEGNTLPSFAQIPIVEVVSKEGDRDIRIPRSEVTTSQFVVRASDSGVSLPFNIDFRIISLETTVVSAGAPGTAVVWPYYCTMQDVDDRLVGLLPALRSSTVGSTVPLNNNVLMNLVSQVYGEINAALDRGGYSTPVANTNKTTITAGISASNNIVTIPVGDDTIFSVGDMAFIHGQTSSTFNAEFVHIVNADSGADTVVAFSLLNAYNNGSTIEAVTRGFNYVRQCNAVGVAVQSLMSPVVAQGRSANSKVVDLNDWYERCLADLSSGSVTLDGLSLASNARFIKSYQTENQNAADVINAPVFRVSNIY